MYDRPIEVYCYNTRPMRTFHEEQDDSRIREPIRLSFHGQNHFNSIVPFTWDPSQRFEQDLPVIENAPKYIALKVNKFNLQAIPGQKNVIKPT